MQALKKLRRGLCIVFFFQINRRFVISENLSHPFFFYIVLLIISLVFFNSSKLRVSVLLQFMQKLDSSRSVVCVEYNHP